MLELEWLQKWKLFRLICRPLLATRSRILRMRLRRGEFEANNHYTGRCQLASGADRRPRCFIDAFLHCCALKWPPSSQASNPGDEVIMPSYTFTSTANAVVLRGSVPVFVDIRPDTLNMDPSKIERRSRPRTKAIFVVHYAGVCADMDQINPTARRHSSTVVEDAAQASLSTYRGRPAGGLGDLGCFSFHASKNIVAGEGGALTINQSDLAERAYVIRKREPTGANFSPDLSTNIAGSMSALRTGPASSQRHSCLRNWRLPKASFQLGLRSGIATTRALPNWKRARLRDGRSCLAKCELTAISTI